MSPWPTTIYRLWQVLSSSDEDGDHDNHDDHDGGGGGGRLLYLKAANTIFLSSITLYIYISNIVQFDLMLWPTCSCRSSTILLLPRYPPQAGSVSSTNDSKLGFSRERSSLYNTDVTEVPSNSSSTYIAT